MGMASRKVCIGVLPSWKRLRAFSRLNPAQEPEAVKHDNRHRHDEQCKTPSRSWQSRQYRLVQNEHRQHSQCNDNAGDNEIDAGHAVGGVSDRLVQKRLGGSKAIPVIGRYARQGQRNSNRDEP